MTQNEFSRRTFLAGSTISILGPDYRKVLESLQGSRYIVGTASDSAVQFAKEKAIKVIRVDKRGFSGKALVGRFDPPTVTELRQQEDIDYVERDGTGQPPQSNQNPSRLSEAKGSASGVGESVAELKSFQALPWGIEKVAASSVHEMGIRGTGADVAVIDSGIDSGHPDLKANLGKGRAFVSYRTSNSWNDDLGHGTHCAGIVAAADNSMGVVGVSPDATLHGVKTIDYNNEVLWSDLASALEWVADQGYDVANMSLGGPTASIRLKEAIKYAHEADVLLVAASGNDSCKGCVEYPAAYEEVIAVSALTEEFLFDDVSSYSSLGPEIELIAPGTDVTSTIPGGSYAKKQGTSMATPHVSGAGALLMANGFSAKEARQRLQQTAENVLFVDNNEEGAGLLNVERALSTPHVKSNEPTSIEANKVALTGTLTYLGTGDVAEVYFRYRETTASEWQTTRSRRLTETGEFTYRLQDLNETEYEWQAVAETIKGVYYGNVRAFSVDEKELSNHLVIVGGSADSPATYDFTIDGKITQTADSGTAPIADRHITVDNEDTITNGEVHGTVAGGGDAYYFAGGLTDGQITGNAKAYLNGKPYDFATDDASSHLVIFGGDSENIVRYSFTVTGEVSKSSTSGGAPIANQYVTLDKEDTIYGSTVSGMTAGGGDAYRFTGSISDASLDGPGRVFVKGKEVDWQSKLTTAYPNHVVFYGGSAANIGTYSFTVSGDLKKSAKSGAAPIADRHVTIDEEDVIEKTANGQKVKGTVGGGGDAYRFSGEIIDYHLDDVVKVHGDWV